MKVIGLAANTVRMAKVIKVKRLLITSIGRTFGKYIGHESLHGWKRR